MGHREHHVDDYENCPLLNRYGRRAFQTVVNLMPIDTLIGTFLTGRLPLSVQRILFDFNQAVV